MKCQIILYTIGNCSSACPALPTLHELFLLSHPTAASPRPRRRKGRSGHSQGYTSMTDPNAPAPGAPSGMSRSEHEVRAGRALQDLALAMIASTILIKGIEA